MMNYAVAVPTYNAGAVWPVWIQSLLLTSVDVKDVYIIDSGSRDNTVTLSEDAGFNVDLIENSAFNHGGTRQRAVSKLAEYEFVLFLTQDAVLKDPGSILRILSPFHDKHVGAVCGRQLPKRGAGAIEKHARLFNYVEQPSTSSIDDVAEKGLKAAFLSNSFAAYRMSALNEVGGFPENVIFGEDMHVAARLLMAGYQIAYAADACVYHSHNYTILQEFSRYFDMGVFHAREPWLRQALGGAENEGMRFMISEIKYLSRHAFWLIPEAMLRTVMRYAGFRLGLVENRISLKIKRKISMNPGYFKIK